MKRSERSGTSCVAVLLAAMALAGTPARAADYVVGDVNNDGVVSWSDV